MARRFSRRSKTQRRRRTRRTSRNRTYRGGDTLMCPRCQENTLECRNGTKVCTCTKCFYSTDDSSMMGM